jgi:hypothetical protein
MKLNKPQQAFLDAILKLEKGKKPVFIQRCPGRHLMRQQIENWHNYFGTETLDDRMSDERTQELSETSSTGVLERT